MQNWQNNGRSGSPQGPHPSIWSGQYGNHDEFNQFDTAQNWSQAVPGQGVYSHLSPQATAVDPSLYASPSQGHAANPADLNNVTGLSGHSNYSHGHNQLAVNDQYSQAGQDEALASFDDYHPDMYGHHNKAILSSDPNALVHGNPQGFSQHPYQYTSQNSQVFNGNLPQYTQSQLIPPHGQQNHTQLQQRFEELPQSYSPMSSLAPHAQQRQPPPETIFTGSPHPYAAPQVNTQHSQPFSTATPPPYQQPQVASYQQPKYMQQQLSYSQTPPPAHSSSFQQPALKQVAESQSIPQVAANQLPPRTLQQQPVPVAATPPQQASFNADLSTPSEQPPKKRKRVAKKDIEPEQADSPSDSVGRKADDVDVHTFPISTEEDLAAMAEFKKRTAAAKKRFPAIPGASFLVSSGTTKLPIPKSYDKLAPLVALPSQSGRRLIPELGYDLPSEIQGKFTDKYRPSPDIAGGLDERRLEAKALLDQYDGDMKAIGKRRPKYTEYPHAFKEQLKADEAMKSKAEKKARKELEEERKKPIRAETRPTDPAEAAAWDILGIVYIDPAATRTSALLAGAVQHAGEFFINIRSEMNRIKQEIDQSVKENKPATEITELKKEAELKKEVLYRALEAAAKHGDDAVLENLGGHQKGVLSLVNVLIGCIKASDFSGKLPKAILHFMSNISMPKRVADNVNFETVRKRLSDKGDDEVKELLKTIASRIKKESDVTNGAEPRKTSSSTTSTTKTSKTTPRTAPDGSPAKRVRDDDSDTRSTKKIAVESTSGSLSSKLGAAKPLSSASIQSKMAAPKPRASTSILPGKGRPAIKPTPKPDSIKTDAVKLEDSNTSSAMDLDKPTVTKVEPKKAVAVKSDPAKVAVAKSVSSSSSALSSIASLLDSINTPKPETIPSQAKESGKNEPPETPEQKAKRLRKESRRQLRVTWKAEDELVQVRIFHKEAAEDEDNMTKDAADDRSEGMMLKFRAPFTEDEEEDDELPYRPWVEPTPTDYTIIPLNYREKSYVTRGGNLTFYTDEQKAMDEREKRELMVIYTDLSDIPLSPKSPPPEKALPNTEVKVGQLSRDEPKYEEIHRRWKDAQQYGRDGAVYYAFKRLDAKHDPATKVNSILNTLKSSSTAPSSISDTIMAHAESTQPIMHHNAVALPASHLAPEEQVVESLNSDKVKNWRDPEPFNPAVPKTHRRHDYPDPGLQTAANTVEDVAEPLKGLPYPATQPPTWLASDEERVREWWIGYQKHLTTKAKKEADERARTEAEANALLAAAAQTQNAQDPWAAYYAQQQQYAQYMALLQQVQGGQPQQPVQIAPTAPHVSATQPQSLGDAQLQALLSQIQQPQSQPLQPQAQAPNNAYALNPNDTGYQQLLMLAQLQQQQQQPQHGGGEQPSAGQDQRTQDYGDARESREARENREKLSKARKGNAPGGTTLPPHRPANRALIGTKPCVFWQQGKCARGDKCTFRHDT